MDIKLGNLTKCSKRTAKNSIRDITLEDNHICGRIDTQENGCLVLALPYHKNWKGLIDGERVQVHRANTMYMAVEVPEGRHEVTFYYDPIELKVGLLLAVFALMWMKNKLLFPVVNRDGYVVK